MEENCWPYEVHVGVVKPGFDIFGRADTEDLRVTKGTRKFFRERCTGHISFELALLLEQYQSSDEDSIPKGVMCPYDHP